MITEDSKNIVILAFNVGYNCDIVNGPGISLMNLIKFCSIFAPNVRFSVFSTFPCKEAVSNAVFYKISNKKELVNKIKGANVVHCWSGLKQSYVNAIKIANNSKIPVIIGPNLYDTVNLSVEKQFDEQVEYKVVLSANPALRFSIAKAHDVDLSVVSSFMVGPDPAIWTPKAEKSQDVLWKGNGRQPVKDLAFAKRVAKKLPEYNFIFMGDKNPYNYMDHIDSASKAAIYINTSASETKGMAQLEQMSAGIPCISHPGVFECGRHYETGFVINKTIDGYVEAVRELMLNPQLRAALGVGAKKYINKNYSPQDIVLKYLRLVKNVC
tara:strand:- start:105 stop:1079 length:975 start_codon:yes stop_codon:yes gene_type:complete